MARKNSLRLHEEETLRGTSGRLIWLTTNQCNYKQFISYNCCHGGDATQSQNVTPCTITSRVLKSQLGFSTCVLDSRAVCSREAEAISWPQLEQFKWHLSSPSSNNQGSIRRRCQPHRSAELRCSYYADTPLAGQLADQCSSSATRSRSRLKSSLTSITPTSLRSPITFY